MMKRRLFRFKNCVVISGPKYVPAPLNELGIQPATSWGSDHKISKI